MAPSEHSHGAKSVSTSPVTVEQIIFSCDVCQAVVSDIYAKKDSDQGFSSGDGDGDGIVVRLWMGDCTHIFCGKHLDGGGESVPPASTRLLLIDDLISRAIPPGGHRSSCTVSCLSRV
jgi:hypothetical protein